MAILLAVLVGAAALFYPFLVYWGLSRFSPRFTACLLLAVFGIRFLLGRARAGAVPLRPLLPLVLVVILTSTLVLIFNRHDLILYNPVLINAVLLLTFAHTLKFPPAMIERFARVWEPEMPPEAVPYCRKVTVVWCVFFAVNGAVALWTALLGDLPLWTLYNGLISYGLMGIVFATEWVVRQVVRRRFEKKAAC